MTAHPLSLEGLNERLSRLETLHNGDHGLSGLRIGAVDPVSSGRLSLSPSPDYRISETPSPEPSTLDEPCSCEEAVSLRARLTIVTAMKDDAIGKVEQLITRVKELEANERELTRWKAMFSTPEICSRELSRLLEVLRHAQTENGVGRKVIERLEKDLAEEKSEHQATAHEFRITRETLELARQQAFEVKP